MKTALITDEPLVAVVCSDVVLYRYISQKIRQHGFTTWHVGSSEAPPREVYKTLVCFTGLEEAKVAEGLLQSATNLHVSSLVVIPQLPPLQSSDEQLMELWSYWAHHLNQLVVQVSRFLPTAQQLLVCSLSGPKQILVCNPTTVLLSPVGSGWYWQARAKYSLIPLDTILPLVGQLLARPNPLPSLLLQSDFVDGYVLQNKTAGLYEHLYHQTLAARTTEPELLEYKTPFAVQLKQVESDPRALAGEIVTQLPPPSKTSIILDSLGTSTRATSDASIIESKKPTIKQKQHSETHNRVVVTTPAPKIPNTKEHPLVGKKVQKPISDTVNNKSDSLSGELDRIFSKTRIVEKEKHLQKLSKTEKKAKKRIGRNKLFFVLGAISTGVSLAIILMGVVFVVTAGLARNELFSQDPKLLFATEENQQTTHFGRLASILYPQVKLVGQFVDHPSINESQTMVSAFERIDAIRTVEQKKHTLSLAIANHVMGQKSTVIETAINDYIKLGQSEYSEMAELESLLALYQHESEASQRWFGVLEETIGQKKLALSHLRSLAPLMPDLMGMRDNKRIYAVLFLNSSELRPTGGFIQALALVTLHQGQIVDVTTMSSYEIDKKIGGVVEPPPDLAAVLNETSWYFRDSNWDPHHPASAERAAWFVQKALGVSVDGVVSIPSGSLASILEATGPLSVTEYNESVTSQNIQERLNYHAEVELTDQVKNYPSALLDALFARITQSTPSEFIAAVNAFPALLDSGDIQISLIDEAEQELFQPLRWSGSLVLPVCPSQFAQVECLVDSVYQVESNIGINRVNTNIDRVIRESVQLNDSQLSHVRTTILKNKALSNAWPNGPYAVYLRWYLPLNSLVDSITINSEEVDKKQWRVSQEHGLQVVGVTLEVPIQTEKEVVLSYTRDVQTNLPYSYFLFDQKQPGAEVASYEVVVTKLGEAAIVRVAPSAQIDQNKLTFSPATTNHRLTAVELE